MRAKNLLKIHEAAHGKRAKPERYLSDAHRAAIVLAISALDAYVRTLVIEKIRVLLTTRHVSLPSSLSERIKTFLKEDGLLEAARKDDLLERVDKAFKKDFERRTFQGVEAIAAGLQWVGYDDIFKTVASDAGKNEDQLKSELEKFTQRRHGIAHRGDYDFSVNPPKELTVTKSDAASCIALVSLIAKHINKVCVP
jgi:hypothetical protein